MLKDAFQYDLIILCPPLQLYLCSADNQTQINDFQVLAGACGGL